MDRQRAEESQRADRLPARLLLAYGLPGLPLAVLTLPLYVYLPAFYAEDVGIGFALVGTILLIARLWDVVTDPLVGLLSDRWNGRWGRRRPWLLAAAPIAIVSAWFLFHPPAGAGWPYLLAWTMALYLAGTMVKLPYEAWGAEISPDYDGRSRIAGYREAFVVIGTLVAAGAPVAFGGGKAEALTLLAWIFALSLPVAVFLACRTVPDTQAQRQTGQRLTWGRGLRILSGNGPFRRLLAAYLINGVANGLPATLFLLYVEHVLQAETWAGPLLFVYFLCGVLSVPVWLRLSAGYGKHRVWSAAMAATCLVFACVPLLQAGDQAWFLAICVLTGFGLGADLVLPPSMQADVIDFDRLRSRQSRAGLYFALWGMATKLALALAVGLAFPILELAGFREDAQAAPPEIALFALAALYSLAPVAFKLVSIALMWGFPLTRARQVRIRRLIEARQ